MLGRVKEVGCEFKNPVESAVDRTPRGSGSYSQTSPFVKPDVLVAGARGHGVTGSWPCFLRVYFTCFAWTRQTESQTLDINVSPVKW